METKKRIKKFILKAFIVLFVLVGFGTLLPAQNAYYDALYLSKLDHEALLDYISFVAEAKDEVKAHIDNSGLTAVEKKNVKAKLASGELQKELLRGLLFIKFPWENELNTKDFKQTFQTINPILKNFQPKDVKKHDIHNCKDCIKNDLHFLESSEIKKLSDNVKRSSLKFKPFQNSWGTPTTRKSVPAAPGKFFNSTFQTNLIDALGTIIAERFKEDVTEIYINKLKKKLEESNAGKIIEKLLPETYQLAIKEDVFQYFSLGKEWKTAFEKDLEKLPQNVVEYLDTIDAIKDKELFLYFKLAFEVSDKLVNGYHPSEILNYLDVIYEGKPKKTEMDIYNVVHFVNLVQLNLHKHSQDDDSSKEEKSTGWVSFSDIQKLMQHNGKGIEYFFVLLCWQDTDFFDRPGFGQKIKNELKQGSEFFKNRLVPIYQIIVKINEFDKKAKGTSEDYAKYMQLGLDVIQEAYYKVLDKNPGQEPNIDLGFKIAQKCLDIYKLIYKKDYRNLISQTLFILREINKNSGDSGTSKFIDVLVKYGAFIEGLANAKNADDMKKMIAAVILPRGSFLEKRTKKFTITLAAHPGVFLGGEGLIKKAAATDEDGNPVIDPNNQEDYQAKKLAWVGGFTAPVGVELSWGRTKKKHCLTPYGIFFSVIDLGAVVSYRLTNSEGDDLAGMPEKIKFKHIFSPGISFHFNFRKSPLTFRLGVQYTPELREIKEKDEIVFKQKTWRFFAGFSWDIPLLKITR